MRARAALLVSSSAASRLAARFGVSSVSTVLSFVRVCRVCVYDGQIDLGEDGKSRLKLVHYVEKPELAPTISTANPKLLLLLRKAKARPNDEAKLRSIEQR